MHRPEKGVRVEEGWVGLSAVQLPQKGNVAFNFVPEESWEPRIPTDHITKLSPYDDSNPSNESFQNNLNRPVGLRLFDLLRQRTVRTAS